MQNTINTIKYTSTRTPKYLHYKDELVPIKKLNAFERSTNCDYVIAVARLTKRVVYVVYETSNQYGPRTHYAVKSL